jgi:transcriptional regulator with GAF, ATPase, and Fis domain
MDDWSWELIGQSPQMRAVVQWVETVSASNATVLLVGESGTGKEAVARTIHHRSLRRDSPFIAVNCSALPQERLEFELFGQVKGTFSGATMSTEGLFEAADGGTLFLDEVGDLAPATQVRLLRVLEAGAVRRLGTSDTVKVDVRVIAGSSVDLAKATELGTFRADLFHRLGMTTVPLPPLRECLGDVPLLAGHFLRMYAEKMGKKVTRISPAAIEALVSYRWIGNVSELQNVIERAVVRASGATLELEDLPSLIAHRESLTVDGSVHGRGKGTAS